MFKISAVRLYDFYDIEYSSMGKYTYVVSQVPLMVMMFISRKMCQPSIYLHFRSVANPALLITLDGFRGDMIKVYNPNHSENQLWRILPDKEFVFIQSKLHDLVADIYIYIPGGIRGWDYNRGEINQYWK